MELICVPQEASFLFQCRALRHGLAPSVVTATFEAAFISAAVVSFDLRRAVRFGFFFFLFFGDLRLFGCSPSWGVWHALSRVQVSPFDTGE
jgi:hypothetical protein